MKEVGSFSKKTVSYNLYASNIMIICGISTFLVFLIPVSIFTITPLTAIPFAWIPRSVCSIFSLSGLYVFYKGTKSKKQINRFKNYSNIINERNEISLNSLANYTLESVSFLTKDVQDMIDKNYFVNTFIDRQRQCVVLKNGKVFIPDSDYELRPNITKEENPIKKDITNKDPEVDKIIKTGQKYLDAIDKVDRKIESSLISLKIIRIEETTEKIFNVIASNPKKAVQIRKFMDYYLPTTLKLLESYSLLESQGIKRNNISSTMDSIEDIMDTIITAFEKQLDCLFEDEALDISTDITVLETMLSQEGLIKDDLDINKI